MVVAQEQPKTNPTALRDDLYDVMGAAGTHHDNGHPHQPTLTAAEILSHRMDAASGSNQPLTIEDIAALLVDLNVDALLDRGAHHAAFVSDASAENNRAHIRETVYRLTRDDEGNKVSVADFQKNLYHIFGAVFTGHPTFSMDPELSGALARYFSHLAGSETHGPETRQELIDAAAKKFSAPNLDSESAQSIAAIKNLHAAINQIEEIAIEVAQQEYPDEWMNIDYMPATVATWIPFDWDGRTDVKWNQLMEKRIGLQMEILPDYIERLEDLKKHLDEADQTVVVGLIGDLQRTLDLVGEHRDFYANYNQDEDEGLKELAAWGRKMAEDTAERITHPNALIEPLQEILDRTDNPEAQQQLVHLRSRLRNHGISLAQIHFRINSRSIINALSQNISVDTSLKGNAIDNATLGKLKTEIKNAQSKQSNIIDVARSGETVITQMAMIRQFVDHLDSHSPIRYLLAETHAATIPMAALYFAKGLGVDNHIDISPLFEDRDGTEEAQRIATVLYSDESYSAHIVEPRPHSLELSRRACFQLGYSDSGRYDGQPAASAFIEQVKGRILKQHARSGMNDVRLCVFDTHGESMGRGTHPGGVRNRVAYINTPWFIDYARRKDVQLNPEESFQGGDGYLNHGTMEASLAYMASALAYLTDDHSNVRQDPYYARRRDTALAFFESTRGPQGVLAQDQGYAELIARFSAFMPHTGSRPVKRQQQSGGERKLPRAIPHNGILAQVGAMANIFYGLRKAIKADPEGYEDMMRNSPEFRMRMAMVEKAMDLSDPYILRDYARLYDPSFWQDRARGHNNPETQDARMEVARFLGKTRDHETFAPVVEQIIADYEFIKRKRQELAIPGDPMNDPGYQSELARKKMNMQVTHGVRMAAIMDIFELAIKIPAISARHEISRNDIIRNIMNLDAAALDELRQVFRTTRNGVQATELDQVKPSGLEMPIDYRGVERDVVALIEEHMDVIGQTSHVLIHHMPGVG